jgi:hypothetical protein
MRVCSVEGCSDRFHAKDMCLRHYVRFRNYGRIDAISRRANELRGSRYTVIGSTSVAITLTRGYEAIIDIYDVEDVTKYTWHAVIDYQGRGGTERVRAQGRVEGVDMYLHQFLLGSKAGMEIDHEDDDPLNCRRNNLNFVTHQENCSYRIRSRK